jgi:hypothetical protein
MYNRFVALVCRVRLIDYRGQISTVGLGFLIASSLPSSSSRLALVGVYLGACRSEPHIRSRTEPLYLVLNGLFSSINGVFEANSRSWLQTVSVINNHKLRNIYLPARRQIFGVDVVEAESSPRWDLMYTSKKLVNKGPERDKIS